MALKKYFNEFSNQFEDTLNSSRFKFFLSKSWEKEPNIASFIIPNLWQFVVKQFYKKMKFISKENTEKIKILLLIYSANQRKLNFLQNVVTHYYRKRFSKNNKSIMQQNFSEETFYFFLEGNPQFLNI